MRRREFVRGTALVAAGAALGARAGATDMKDAQPLLTRRIPSSGEALPVIGLGTSGPFEVGPGADERDPLREVLQAHFAAGATVVDTSPMYSTAQSVLGALLTPAMQKQAFIATKVWTQGEAAGIAQMQESMAQLKRAHVDLMQVHNLLDLSTQLATLRKWKEQGRIRYIGVTHYTDAKHDDIVRIVQRESLDFIQINYSVGSRNAEKRLLPACAERGVATLINRPFEDGGLFARVKGRALPAFAADIDCASWAQLMLKFIIANPAVTCVIPATGKVRNALDNLGAGRGRLPDAKQCEQIVAAIAA
jgi:diketogulonate reductase-like aldo/keto reductase